MKLSKILLLFIVTLALVSVELLTVAPVAAFGKNKVQYTQFEWKFLYTRHFKVFFYDGGRDVADFAAEVAEKYYDRISAQYQYSLKRRIPLIIYKSHNDFKQTNIIMEMLEEETGGFTEIFKNRVVLPYQGSYEDLRHVVEHELTHAVMFEMIYGSNIFETLYNVNNLMHIPLWFMEGCAEYQSLDWDIASDVVLRDAIINDRFRSIEDVHGYLYYKGGQSFIRFIAKNYGEDKIGDIIRAIRSSKNIDKALKGVLGISLEDIDKEWMRELRKDYWPELRYRDEPDQVGHKFTDHTEDGSYFNVAPAVGPKGDKIIFFSDRRDYVDIYLMSAIDGTLLKRLVKGERSSSYESFNWLKARLTWAPDNKRIAFTAISAGEDVLYVYDIKSNRTLGEYRLGFDAISSPTWSPQEEKIVFSGVRNGHADLYMLDLETREVTQLTHDVADDIQPDWFSDGTKLAFSSDRNWQVTSSDSTGYPHTYGVYNIFTYDLLSKKITAVTQNTYNCMAPSWHPDSLRLVYVAYYNGIPNLSMIDAAGTNSHALTNTLTGCYTPDWSPDGKKIVFTQYDNGGWDIYVIKNPEEHIATLEKMQPTPFMRKQRVALKVGSSDSLIQDTSVTKNMVPQHAARADSMSLDMDVVLVDSNNVLDSITHSVADTGVIVSAHRKQEKIEEDTMVSVPPLRVARKYEIEFSPDIVTLQFYANSFSGPAGLLYLTFSDILGNHRFSLYLQSRQSKENSLDFTLGYFYLPHRIDIGGSGFHETNLYAFNDSLLFSDRLYGISTVASYPFNKFKRIEVGVDLLRIEREHLGINQDFEFKSLKNEKREVVQPYLQYSHDTVLWGHTGPINGMRAFIHAQYSHKFGTQNASFITVMADWRKYVRFLKKYNFVFRASGGQSAGEGKQVFYLGGTQNYWTGSGVSSTLDEEAVWGIDNFYFGQYITPLRGVQLYEGEGNGYVLGNLEFRYPFIRYLVMGWPFGLAIQNVRGSLFFDAASVWDNGLSLKDVTFEGGSIADEKVTTLCGMGVGARLNVGFAVLRFDVAWKTDLLTVAHKPFYYFSLGGEF